MTDFVEPQNYSAAKKLAREVFGYQLVKNEWGEIEVYLTNSKDDTNRGVYHASDWQDAWDTMKSMWRAENSIAKNNKQQGQGL